MGRIFRSKKTLADEFREVVDIVMSEVLNRVAPKEPKWWTIKKMALKSKKDLGYPLGKLYYRRRMSGNSKSKDNGEVIVFESMEEVLKRGKTDKPYKKTRNETTSEVIISCGGDGNYSDAAIDKKLSESWASSKGKDHNFVWQRVYLEVLTYISKSKNLYPIMKDFNDQIANEYGHAVWNAIFDKDQRFFIMLWRMNVSYSSSNVKNSEGGNLKKRGRRRLKFVIREFYKLMNKASMDLGKQFGRVNFDSSNADVLENFFKTLLNEIKQDETARMYMLEISNYFAKDFGKMLWYESFSELQKFVIVCLEVDRANQIIKQYSEDLSRN